MFQETDIQIAWRRLLNDRESLVWRYVAVARGLLSGAIEEFAQDILNNLATNLTPTEWRRAAVSLTASVAIDPKLGAEHCVAMLDEEWLRRDAGLAGTMIFGLARAAEVEPETAENLLNQAVRVGGLEGAEALVELRRERIGNSFGDKACEYVAVWLKQLLDIGRIADDGHIALCEALQEEVAPRQQREQPTLRERLDDALWAFAERSSRDAYQESQRVLEAADEKLNDLEQSEESDSRGRRRSFRTMRELDMALLETAALYDLLAIGAKGKHQTEYSTRHNELFERLSNWLVRAEREPIRTAGPVKHLTLRLKRMRTLLHLVDADGIAGEETSEQRRERRIRIARVLFTRNKEDATTPLRRVVCASLARACDALVRDRLFELSDVFIGAVDHVPFERDLITLAEASMTPEFQAMMIAYANLIRATGGEKRVNEKIRPALDALVQIAQSIPWAGTLRVSALRTGLIRLARDLEEVAAADSLQDLTGGAEGATIGDLTSTVYSLAQLTSGARWRLVGSRVSDVPASASVLSALGLAMDREISNLPGHLEPALDQVSQTLKAELPAAVAEASNIILSRVIWLAPSEPTSRRTTSAGSHKQEPLPPWLPAHRTIGGFYVVRSLGAGGVGSVFVVKRVEDRHDPEATYFALKVPDYNAEAARTLSEEEFLKLFREEAGALLQLPNHPNLATFVTFDAGARPKPILVMELVEGPSLERFIQRGGMHLQAAFALLDGVSAGLLTMHEKGIGHLDVKPSNVILRESISKEIDVASPVLVDFGLAGKRLRPGCATVPYGAPEVWGLTMSGRRTPTPMGADTYAFACLAFEALTGEILFDEPDELSTINAHLSHDGNPRKLSRLRGNTRLRSLCDLLGNALRRDARQRLPMRELSDGLRALAPAFSGLPWPLRSI